MGGGPRNLGRAQLEPELRGLVHRLEQQLIRVDLLFRRLLQREQIVRPQVALVVRRPLPGQDRLGEILVCLGRQGPAEHTSPAMSDLFSDAAEQRLPDVAPLALRMRPESLDEFVGQEHVLGEGSALRLAIEEDRVRSAIFYGPPGTGKTTLARIVARVTEAEFEELSAVSATVAQVREVLARARGDARSVHNIVELAWQTAQAAGEPLSEAHVEDAARKRPLVYDKAADAHYDFISAFIKSMRGSDPDASVYYLAAMLESGEDARFIARRMIVLASEDIGNADPRALLVAVAAAQAVEHVGLPEARLNLAQAAIYLARAPKSNASYLALKRASADVRERGAVPPPKSLRNASWHGRKLGHGDGYIYPHDDPAGFEASYLPEE